MPAVVASKGLDFSWERLAGDHFDELGAGGGVGHDFGGGDLAGALEFFEEALADSFDAGAGFFPFIPGDILDGEHAVLFGALDFFGSGDGGEIDRRSGSGYGQLGKLSQMSRPTAP